MGPESLTRAKVTAYQPTSSETQQAKVMWLRLADAGITPQELADAQKDARGEGEVRPQPRV